LSIKINLMSVKLDAKLTDKEFKNLHHVLGEFRRIARDHFYRFVKTNYCYSESEHNKEIYLIAESLFKKLVEDTHK